MLKAGTTTDTEISSGRADAWYPKFFHLTALRGISWACKWYLPKTGPSKLDLSHVTKPINDYGAGWSL
jgi:hypothetical protein